MAGRTREFAIPNDLPKLLALGGARKVRWSRKSIERRLASLDADIEKNFIPDAHGHERQIDGRTCWECVPVPDELADHMETLRDAMAMVRRKLADENREAASDQMDGIEALVRDMCDRVNQPIIKRGLSFSGKPTVRASAQRKRDGNATKARLVAKACDLLACGKGLHKSGRVNVSELARLCRESALHLGQRRARGILGEARIEGKLAIRPTK